jgi:hypothetical protein
MRVRLCQLTAGARFVACAPFFAKVARQTLARALRVLPSHHGSETSRFAGLWSFSAKHTPMPFWAGIAPRLGREAARVRKVARVAKERVQRRLVGNSDHACNPEALWMPQGTACPLGCNRDAHRQICEQSLPHPLCGFGTSQHGHGGVQVSLCADFYHGPPQPGPVCSAGEELPRTPAAHTYGKSKSTTPGCSCRVSPCGMKRYLPGGAGSVYASKPVGNRRIDPPTGAQLRSKSVLLSRRTQPLSTCTIRG